MGSGDDDIAGKVKDKARAAVDGLFGKDGSIADEDPNIEYEPTPKQEIMHDGMVVLSEQQSEEAGTQSESSGGSEGESDR